MTPSELLNAAADRVQEAAKQAGAFHDCARSSCGGFADYNGPCGGCCSCLSGCVYDGPDDDLAPGSWLDLLRPATVAPAIEQMLRDAATDWDLRARIFTPESMQEHVDGRRFRGVLAFARVIVGDAS